MTTHTGLTLQSHDPRAATAVLDTLTSIWTAAHAGHPDVADAGFTPEALRRQITGHTRHDRFTLITAHRAGGQPPIGFGYGFRCSPAYWLGAELLATINSPVTTAKQIAGLCELAVLPAHQGHGVGTAIHRALLDALGTDWASLLAMPGDDRPEQRLYRTLGYRYAGPLPERTRRAGARPPPAPRRR